MLMYIVHMCAICGMHVCVVCILCIHVFGACNVCTYVSRACDMCDMVCMCLWPVCGRYVCDACISGECGGVYMCVCVWFMACVYM